MNATIHLNVFARLKTGCIEYWSSHLDRHLLQSASSPASEQSSKLSHSQEAGIHSPSEQVYSNEEHSDSVGNELEEVTNPPARQDFCFRYTSRGHSKLQGSNHSQGHTEGSEQPRAYVQRAANSQEHAQRSMHKQTYTSAHSKQTFEVSGNELSMMCVVYSR